MHHQTESREAVVRRVILDDMHLCYNAPKGSSQARVDALFITYIDGLIGYSEGVLKAAWEKVKQSHKSNQWPYLGTITEACDGIANTDTGRLPELPPDESWKFEAFAERVMQSKLGEKSFEGKWHKGLWDFAAATGKTPTQRDIRHIRKWQRKADEHVALLKSLDQRDPMTRISLSAYRAMQGRSDELIDRFYTNCSGETSETLYQDQPGKDSDNPKHKAEEMLRDYMDDYEDAALAQQAKAEGWLDRLIEVVRCFAEYQAALISGVRNPGVSSDAYLAFTSQRDPGKAYKRIVHESARQAATGAIAVHLPRWLVDGWRGNVRREVAA